MDSGDDIAYSFYYYLGKPFLLGFNHMSTIVGIFIAVAVLLVIAFPEQLLPAFSKKKKRIGITHWGFYNGSEDCKPEETMLVEAALPGKQRYVVGSSMYAKGQGVKANASK
jgi:hypothetical protein